MASIEADDPVNATEAKILTSGDHAMSYHSNAFGVFLLVQTIPSSDVKTAAAGGEDELVRVAASVIPASSP